MSSCVPLSCKYCLASRCFLGITFSVFLKLVCGWFCDTRNIGHLMSLGKHICVLWKDFCFWSIRRLFNLVFTKKSMEKMLKKLFWGAFFWAPIPLNVHTMGVCWHLILLPFILTLNKKFWSKRGMLFQFPEKVVYKESFLFHFKVFDYYPITKQFNIIWKSFLMLSWLHI